jgi:uncharacterized protein with NRDE domain
MPLDWDVCTLIAAFQVSSRWPLIVAANRDEHLDRASSPPRLWPGNPAFIAPRDEVAGGTWLGLNQAGLFLGVTNRFGVQRDEHRASRGKLVAEALSEPSARALHLRLAGLAADRFNAFHLFYADRTSAGVTWSDGEKLRQAELEAGVHIVTERSLGGDDQARTELIRSKWRELDQQKLTVEDLAGLLRIHGSTPIGGTCIHAPALNYGTRSSTILFLGPSPAASRLLWAEGNPCTESYASQDELLRQLDEALTAPPGVP